MDGYNNYANNINNNNVNKVFADRGCVVLRYINDDLPIEYRCVCGKIRVQRLEQFKKQRCRHCSYVVETSCPSVADIVELSGEVWRRICGGWVSSWGNAKNIHGKQLTLCPTKIRYRINGRHEYASRLVARAFHILGWEQLLNQKYVVTHIDKNKFNNHVENLKVISKMEIDHSYFKKRRSDEYVDVTNVSSHKIVELPGYTIYENGEIYNGIRFLRFSVCKESGYKQVCLKKSALKTVKVHRLVCYAFNPIKGLDRFSDYANFQVNHKDGNPGNNSSKNLEWVHQSDNIQHSYNYGLNNKTTRVVQKNRDTDEILAKFTSVSEASRISGESYYMITKCLKSGLCNNHKSNWELAVDTQKTYTDQQLNFVTVPDFPTYRIYANGNISKQYLFLKSTNEAETGYDRIYMAEYGSTYVHRVICYAYNPINNLMRFKDYSGIRVKHLDGNKLNNTSTNLEWIIESSELLPKTCDNTHKYSNNVAGTELNCAKLRPVIQSDKDSGDVLAVFRSVAEAARVTGEKEHSIREYMKGKPASTRKYNWQSADPERDAERSQKYSRKCLEK